MTKKTTEGALDALTKEYQKQNTITLNFGPDSKRNKDAQLTAEIRTHLTLPEKSRFVDRVAAGCFADGQYIPEYLSVMKELSFYQIFTDLPLPTMAAADIPMAANEEHAEGTDNEENPLQIDVQKVHDRCQALGLIEKACAASPKVRALYEELCFCADEQVSFLKRQLLSQEHHMLEKVSQQLVEMSDQMNEVATNAAGMLDGLGAEQISKLLDMGAESV